MNQKIRTVEYFVGNEMYTTNDLKALLERLSESESAENVNVFMDNDDLIQMHKEADDCRFVCMIRGKYNGRVRPFNGRARFRC